MSKRIKRWGVRVLLRLVRFYLQAGWIKPGKRFCWERLCLPYVSWRDEDYLCKTRFGCRLYANPLQFVENRILFFGVWEPEITALFRRLVRPGDVVLDVGANVGYYTLLASRLVGPEGRVYAVEPSASIRARLARNLEMNRAANVRVLPYAAWNEEGAATFYIAGGDRGNSSLRKLEDAAACETVRRIALDEVIEPEDAGRVRLVKIDVEGAEFQALQGLTALLRANRHLSILSEVSPELMVQLGGSAADMFRWLAGHGFRPYEVENDYTVEAYLTPHRVRAPALLSGPPTGPSEVLFRREESA